MQKCKTVSTEVPEVSDGVVSGQFQRKFQEILTKFSIKEIQDDFDGESRQF